MQVHSGYSALVMFDVTVMLFTLWESMFIIIIHENYVRLMHVCVQFTRWRMMGYLSSAILYMEYNPLLSKIHKKATEKSELTLL